MIALPNMLYVVCDDTRHRRRIRILGWFTERPDHQLVLPDWEWAGQEGTGAVSILQDDNVVGDDTNVSGRARRLSERTHIELRCDWCRRGGGTNVVRARLETLEPILRLHAGPRHPPSRDNLDAPCLTLVDLAAKLRSIN